MSQYNYFGAAYGDIANLFSNVVDADLGGQTEIEAVMDIIEAEIVSNMHERFKRSLKRVDGMYIESSATSGQTAITVTAGGGIHYNTQSNLEVWVNYIYPGKMPVPGTGDTHGGGITVADSSGNISITMTDSLSLNDYVMMCCDLDPTNANYSIETLKLFMRVGSAALLGPKIYSQEDTSPVGMYVNKYKDFLKRIGDINLCKRAIPEIGERKSVMEWDKGTMLLTGRLIR